MVTGNLIRWSSAPEGSSWTKSRVYRSATESGVYSLIAVQSASDTTYWDVNGAGTDWYKVTFYDDVAAIESDASPPFQAGQVRGYSSIEDVRRYTLVQASEYNDDAIQLFIDNATRTIDSMTGRSWQGYNIEQNVYLDGDGSDSLYLQHGDIFELTKVEVLSGTLDRSVPSNWVEIPIAKVLVDSDTGKLTIDGYQNPNEWVFPNGIKTVRVNYSWGLRDPTDDVRYLCLLMVSNMLKLDVTRTAEIDALTKRISKKAYVLA